MKTSIVFFGTPMFAVPFLKALLAQESFDVVGVVTQPDKPVGRKHLLTKPAVKVAAEFSNIPVYQFPSLKNEQAVHELTELHADVFVVVAYGKLIPKSILDIPKNGCLNVHPSLLPKYRGPSPLQQALLQGDAYTGISIMLLDDGMDTGPVLAQTKIPLDDRETYSSLEKKIMAIGPFLLIETLLKWMMETIKPIKQDERNACITPLLERDDGNINWRESSKRIDQKIRAYETWPRTYFTWIKQGKKTRVAIRRAMWIDRIFHDIPVGCVISEFDQVLIVCGDHKGLALLEIQPEGKNPMNPRDYLRGHPSWEQVAV